MTMYHRHVVDVYGPYLWLLAMHMALATAAYAMPMDMTVPMPMSIVYETIIIL